VRPVSSLSRVHLLTAGFLLAALLVGCTEPRHPSGSGPSPTPPLSRTAPCPGPNVVDGPSVAPDVAAFWRTVIGPVYEAACAGDERRLARLIDTGHGSAEHFSTHACEGCTGNDVVAMWKHEYGVDPTALARLLETPPHLFQGGVTYLHGNRAAVFARGTHEIAAQWSGFYADCAAESLCRSLSGRR
jgi:hypothetical protein